MNYAFGGNNSSSPSLNTGNFRDWAGNADDFSKTLYEQEPSTAYDKWIRSLNPSNAQDQALRRLYEVMQSRYADSVLMNPQANSGLRWVDWLAQVNPSFELAKLSPQQRGEQPQRYYRPIRYVSF